VHACVRERRAEEVSKPPVGSAEVQLGAVSPWQGSHQMGMAERLPCPAAGCAAPGRRAGQLGSSPAPLPCSGASHTPLLGLQALKTKPNKQKKTPPVKLPASHPCVVQRRWSMGLNRALPFSQPRGLDLHCPTRLAGEQPQERAGEALEALGKGGGPSFVPVPGRWLCPCQHALSVALCHLERGGPVIPRGTEAGGAQ